MSRIGGLRTDPFNSFTIRSQQWDYYTQSGRLRISQLPGGMASATAASISKDHARRRALRSDRRIHALQPDVSQRLCEARLRKPTDQAMLYIAISKLQVHLLLPQRSIHTVCTLMVIEFLLRSDKHIGG